MTDTQITRWAPYVIDGGYRVAYGEMEEDEIGDWVNYEDHTAHIDAQDAKIKTLVEALQGVSQFFAMPHENATDRFDRLAEQYLREAGKWAPGKSVPDAYNDSTDCETRRKDYDEWVQSKVDTSRTAIAAAKEPT